MTDETRAYLAQLDAVLARLHAGDPVTSEAIKAKLSDRQALTLTMYGEARGDALQGGSSVEERIAVGCVIRNRLAIPHRFGATWKAVCLQRAQFSCWWLFGGRSNYAHVLALATGLVNGGAWPTVTPYEARLWTESQFLADGILGAQLLDSTRKATHYYAPAAMVPKGAVPGWAVGVPLARIGGHLFFAA